jgi:hypothetical protein
MPFIIIVRRRALQPAMSLIIWRQSAQNVIPGHLKAVIFYVIQHLCIQIPEVPKSLIFSVIQHLRTQIPEARKQSFYMLPAPACLTSGNPESSHFPCYSASAYADFRKGRGRSKEIIFYVVQPLRVGKIRKAHFPEPPTEGRNRPFATVETLHPYSLFNSCKLYSPRTVPVQPSPGRGLPLPFLCRTILSEIAIPVPTTH